jgi:HNH endonuclease
MDPNALKDLLVCDPKSGRLFWKPRPRHMFLSDRDMKKWNTRYAGAEALTSVHTKGYRRGSINCKSVYAHKVVYIMSHGPLGDGMMVDHINGDRLDNRACNLRAVTHIENCHNQTSKPASSTGERGVHLVKRDGTFQARIRTVRGSKTLSGFKTIVEAAEARKKMEVLHWGK